MYNGTMWHVYVTTVDVEEQYVLNTMNVCLSTCLSSMQGICATLSSVASLSLLQFSTLSQTGHSFLKKLLKIKFVF